MLFGNTPLCVVVHMKEPHDVYIGRPSKWGNPFSHIEGKGILVKNRTEAIKAYEEWLTNGDGMYLLNDLSELKGKRLGCWCKSNNGHGKDKPCHGDILAKLVNKLCI
ncbi:MAG: DUF4326 domain-containing protein [Bacteroidales bacterium]